MLGFSGRHASDAENEGKRNCSLRWSSNDESIAARLRVLHLVDLCAADLFGLLPGGHEGLVSDVEALRLWVFSVRKESYTRYYLNPPKGVCWWFLCT